MRDAWDSALLSPKRIALALAQWVWFQAVPDEPIYIPLRELLLYHRRPQASHRAGNRY